MNPSPTLTRCHDEASADAYSRYLTSIERRLSQMEELFSEIAPNVNLEEALASSSSSSWDPARASSVMRAEPSSAAAAPAAPAVPVAGPTPAAAIGSYYQDEAQKSIERTEDSIHEAVPDEADGFDWQEDVNELADGMAALSVEPKGAGYLGTFFPVCTWIAPSKPTMYRRFREMLTRRGRFDCWRLLSSSSAFLARSFPANIGQHDAGESRRRLVARRECRSTYGSVEPIVRLDGVARGGGPLD